MTIWIRQHLAAGTLAYKQILKAPGLFLFNVLVVAVALSLPIAGLTLLENSRSISSHLSIEPELSVFLNADVNRLDAQAFAETIKKQIKSHSTPAKVAFIPRETALSSLQSHSELGDVIATLGNNPLPDAYVLRFQQPLFRQSGEADEQSISPAKIEALAAGLQKLPEVNHVQIDSDWLKRLAALMHLLEFVLIGMAATLCIVVVTVIFNATRLQVLSHRAEMGVIRLLGATNPYIRRPYFYIGAFLGLIAGAAALGLVAAALQPLNAAIVEFAQLYGSGFQLAPLNLSLSAYLLILSTFLGLCGAFLSVRIKN